MSNLDRFRLTDYIENFQTYAKPVNMQYFDDLEDPIMTKKHLLVFHIHDVLKRKKLLDVKNVF